MKRYESGLYTSINIAQNLSHKKYQMIINFKEKVPEFGRLNHDQTKITTIFPHKIFANKKLSKGNIFFDMKCCCDNPDCKNGIVFWYSGLDHYTTLKNHGSNTEVNIHPKHEKTDGKANNVIWGPSEENVKDFLTFTETVREAISFKKELIKNLYAELQVRIKDNDEIRIIVRKKETEFHFILFEIPNTLLKVPLLWEAQSYNECLGVIATSPDMDTSKIKNDWADMKNPFFEPVTKWVKLLEKENQLDLVIERIWVMPK